MKANEIFENATAVRHVDDLDLLLEMMLAAIGCDWQERLKLKPRIIDKLKSTRESDAADGVIRLFEPYALDILPVLNMRASQIVEQILPWIVGSVLDYGCGDGLVAKHLHESKLDDNHPMQLFDVADERSSDTSDNPPFTTDPEYLAGRQFGTILLLNVLHNAEHPDRILDSISGKAKRLVVIDAYNKVYEDAGPNAIMDWLFNCIVYQNPSTEWSYHTWIKSFRISEIERRGFKLIDDEDLGLDLHVDPVPHRLLVFDRK